MKKEIADYLAAGWALCKIKSREKGAFETGWSSAAGAYTSANPDGLSDWSYGVGLLHAYSGTCCIDIDDLKLAVPAFEAAGIDLRGLLRAPGAVVWWRGLPTRMKLLYAVPEPIVGVARHQHGFELRCASASGTSQQDVLPGAVHESGEPYRWLKGDWRNLPPLPDELRRAWPRAKMLWPETAPGPKASIPSAAASSLTAAAMVGAADSAFEGNRNEWLSGQLYAHLKRGGDYEASLEWLQRLNQEKCSPPEDEDKVFKIWRNKAGIEPDPIVIPAALPGAEPLVFTTKPELPFGYEWDGNWIRHQQGNEKVVISKQPVWVAGVVRTRDLAGREVRGLEVMVGAGGPHVISYDNLISRCEVTLGHIGLNVIEDDAKRMRRYLVRGKELCESKGMIVDTYDTFGWQADDSFLVGNLLYRPDLPPQRVALAESLRAQAASMGAAARGSLAGWRECAEELMQSENKSQAFGLLMGAAAPLMKLSGEKGGIYSMVGDSGQGKSTAQNAIGTIFGDPEAFRTVPRDTSTARMIKLSQLSNLPMIAEEMTKMETEDLRTLAFAVSEGRDKERADQNGELRLRAPSWATLLVASSNTSLMDTLLAADGAPAAFRLLEDQVSLAKGAKQSDGDRIMRGLVANQGHAGHVIAQYMVDHRMHLERLIHRTAAQLADKVHGSTKERIRINMLACAFVAAAVLNATGVLRFNVASFVEYGTELLRRNMGQQQEAEVSPADVLQAFIDKNLAGVLRMKADSPLNVTSIQGRTSPLIMRYDISTEELMIHQGALHAYVQERKMSWLVFTKWLETEGYLKDRTKRMLSRNSGLPATPQVKVLILDNAKMGALDAADTRTSLTKAAMA